MGPVRQNPIQRTVRSVHMCVHCTVHNCYTQCIAQNRPDNFPSYPLHNHHCSDDVYLREGEKQLSGRIATVILADNCFSPLQGSRPHIFNRQKIQGDHSPQTISARGIGHCSRKIISWKQGPISRKFRAIGQAYFSYHLLVFSLDNIRTPWGDAPSLVPYFSAFIIHEIYIFVCQCVEPLRRLSLYVLPIDSGSTKNEIFIPPNFQGWGKKFRKQVLT